jgi:transcriptional regulator of aromatic amino acid metabolism
VTGAQVPERMYDAEVARHVLEDLPTPVAYLDPGLTVAVCNPAGASVFGRSAEDVVGRRIEDLVSVDSGILRALRETVDARAPRSVTFVWPLTHGDDEPRMLAASLVPDVGKDGSLEGVLVTAYETTEQMTSIRRSARFGESLNVILQAIARMSDPIELLDSLASESLGAVNGDYSLVSIQSGGSWVVTHHHGTGGEDRIGVEYPIAERPVIEEAAATGEV